MRGYSRLIFFVESEPVATPKGFEYVLEIIDPAALPYRSFNMSRKKKIVIGIVAGGLLATFAVLATVLLTSMWRTLSTYRQQMLDEGVDQISEQQQGSGL